MLKDVVPNDVALAFLAVSTAIWQLNGDDEPTEDQVDEAERMLHFFYRHTEEFLGTAHCDPAACMRVCSRRSGNWGLTLNTHVMCMHLAPAVRLWGPLWGYSCWAMESAGAGVAGGLHGFYGAIQQVTRQLVLRTLMSESTDGHSHPHAGCASACVGGRIAPGRGSPSVDRGQRYSATVRT